MGYEVFARKVVRTGTPAISINSFGRVGINQSATAILRKNGVEYVLLLWDKDELKIGIQQGPKTDTRAYRLAFSKKGSGASFSAKTFFVHINYDFSKTRSFAAEWNPKEKMLEIEITSDGLESKQPQLRKPGRPRKTESSLL
ncbi:MAG: hypothetical protein HYY46_26355 [Deltaproteobacteria bacterium]|nr:hypothetical protein [Deltaproteobacteria bacterium]